MDLAKECESLVAKVRQAAKTCEILLPKNCIQIRARIKRKND